MNRNDEFIKLKEELDQIPLALEYTVGKALNRAKKCRKRSVLLKIPIISFSIITTVFIILVNMFPAVANAMSNVPGLKELVQAVTFDRSLKEAVEHEYYQEIGETQIRDDVTVTVDYMILDASHISLFFSVDAPVKNGSWNYDFKDAQGKGLEACFSYDTMYEVGKMEEISIDYANKYQIPDEFTFTLTLNQNINFQEWREEGFPTPEVIPSPTEFMAEKTSGKDYTFTFRLYPDKQFTKTVTTITIDQWIEVMNQRIYLKSLDIYPTQARLNIECDKANSAVLKTMKLYYKDNKGDIYTTRKNNVTTFYDIDGQNIATLCYESSYFADADQLNLYIEGITVVDKDKLYGVIDYSNKTITNLPEGVSVESMVLKNDVLDISLKVKSIEPNKYESILSMQYYDMSGNSYMTNLGMSTDPDIEMTYSEMFEIPNYEDHKYKVNWVYAPMQAFDFPIVVKLK